MTVMHIREADPGVRDPDRYFRGCQLAGYGRAQGDGAGGGADEVGEENLGHGGERLGFYGMGGLVRLSCQ